VNKNLLYRISILSGILIIGYALFIYVISPDYTYAATPSRNEVVFYVIIRILIGIVYSISVIIIIKKLSFSVNNLIFVFLIGLIARIILVPSEPILEDDFNRYMWDGAVTVNGFNPYQYAPKDFLEKNFLDNDSLYILYNLADESGVIIDRINHPHIRTIYPPVAQIGFGLAYIIKPWSTTVWKGLLLVIDILVFYLLILLLQKLNYPKIFVVIYWWNPILLHEIFNAGHMDVLIYPLILFSILLFTRNKFIWSAIIMAVSVGVKIWTIAFLPLIFRKVINRKRILFYSILLSTLVVLVILFPIIVTKLDDTLGFVTYTKNWTNNESIFQLINILVKEIIRLFNINYHCSLCAARWVVAIFFLFVVGYLSIKPSGDNKNFAKRLLIIVALLYLVSPTQFPWYYTWVLPLLVLNPRLSFILYAVFLPLYQLKYFWHYLIWIEHLPIVLLFIVELFKPRIADYLLYQRIDQ